MLPHKHYAAPEIEQVLQKQEDPTVLPHECGAEESTLRRWGQEFPQILSALAASLESLVNVSMTRLVKKLSDRHGSFFAGRLLIVAPLQRVYNALALLACPPPEQSRLAWAFFLARPT